MSTIATSQLHPQPAEECHLEDETALSYFFNKYYQPLYLYANGICADEDYAMIFTETICQLHQAIATLPRQCRVVMESIFIEDRIGAETAKYLNLRPSTVHTHKRMGNDALRKRIIRQVFITFCM